MAKLWASPPAGDRVATSRAAREPVGERPTGTPPPVDVEMQELVRRFEQGYAELAPPSPEEAQRKAASGDDLFADFPDVFAEPLPARPTVAASARVVPISRREAEVPPPAPVPSWPREAAADNDVDLDEAMAILRESEQRTRPAPRPEQDEPESPAPSPSTHRRQETGASARPTPQPSPAMDWTARSHTARTVAGIAAIVALAVGVAGGYLLARTPVSKSPSAHIESSQQGGTQLRLERNLPQR